MKDSDKHVLGMLYKIRLTTLEMLQDRGYQLNREESKFVLNAIRYPEEEVHKIIKAEMKNGKTELKQFIEQIREQIEATQVENFENFAKNFYELSIKKKKTVREMMSRVYDHKNKEGRCLVYYVDILSGKEDTQKDTIGNDEIRLLIYKIKEENVTKAILISPKPLSQPAGEQINNLTAYTIDFFLEKNLLINPTKHVLVPKHEALTEKESENFRKEVKEDIKNYPILLTTDVVCRYYGFRTSQIVKIYNIQFNESMYKTISYKVIHNLLLEK